MLLPFNKRDKSQKRLQPIYLIEIVGFKNRSVELDRLK